MADHKDPKDKQEYSVDDILAEYGSGKYGKPKVVEFPGREDRRPEPGPQRPVRPKQPPRPEPQEKQPEGDGEDAGADREEDDGIVEIEPVSPFHGLAARFHTLIRRADHYADHMYDQAEPDEETVKAERYIPGVDREEVQEEEPEPRPARRVRPARPAPPDTAPADLAARFARGTSARRIRLVLALLCSLACAVVSVDIPALMDWSADMGQVPMGDLRLALLAGLLLAAGLLCIDVVGRGLASLCLLRPSLETLPAMAFLFTLADALALLFTHCREGLPCCAVTAFGLLFTLWGEHAHREGDRLSCRAAAQAREPYVVTLDEKKWSGRPAYAKWSGTQVGFGSQVQTEDGVRRAYAVAAPVLLLACLVCAGLSAAQQGSGWTFLWTASATLTAASPWAAPLVYAIPYRKLARRLFGSGAALAGWAGISRCREGGILMTDGDLFPTGAVRVSGVRVFGDFPNEKVVAYTATLLRVLDCGLTRPFHDLLRSQGSFYREASAVRFHEGGVTGAIRNQEVFVGTAAFMHLMDVDLPQGLNVKHAIFCAIDGQLAGIFALHYALSSSVNPCLSALMRAKVSPILATRDPNLIPALLGQKFKLPVDKMEFPPVDRRLELSGREQDHDSRPVALLSREGLAPYCDAVVGGRRLRSAARWGAAVSLAGSVLGVALTFYLTYVGAVSSLTAVNFLVFMALWMVPSALLSHWVNQY